MEDQDNMCNVLRVQWTITPRTAPQPWLACSGCGDLRAFQASGKIRLNANGRKLDAWLIYKCLICDKSWNRPIFERQNVRDISPSVMEALQSNDPQWIRAETFNLEALRRKSQRIDEFPEFDIEKRSRTNLPTGPRPRLISRFHSRPAYALIVCWRPNWGFHGRCCRSFTMAAPYGHHPTFCGDVSRTAPAL